MFKLLGFVVAIVSLVGISVLMSFPVALLILGLVAGWSLMIIDN